MGDIAAQYLEQRGSNKDYEFAWNKQRTLNFASFGVLVNGPILTRWYPYLDRTTVKLLSGPRVQSFLSKLPSALSAWSAPVTKVVIETTMFDVPFLTLFYAYINAVEGGTIESCRHKLDSQLLNSFVAGLALWPVVQLTNFRFVPLLYQPYVVNVVCVAWDGYLSHQNHRTHGDEHIIETTGNNNNNNSVLVETPTIALEKKDSSGAGRDVAEKFIPKVTT